MKLLLHDQRKWRKTAVLFQFTQKVENLQQPEYTDSHQSEHSRQRVTCCELGGARFEAVAARSQTRLTTKQKTKICFWNHLRQETDNAVRGSPHRLVWQFNLNFMFIILPDFAKNLKNSRCKGEICKTVSASGDAVRCEYMIRVHHKQITLISLRTSQVPAIKYTVSLKCKLTAADE